MNDKGDGPCEKGLYKGTLGTDSYTATGIGSWSPRHSRSVERNSVDGLITKV